MARKRRTGVARTWRVVGLAVGIAVLGSCGRSSADPRLESPPTPPGSIPPTPPQDVAGPLALPSGCLPIGVLDTVSDTTRACVSIEAADGGLRFTYEVNGSVIAWIRADCGGQRRFMDVESAMVPPTKQWPYPVLIARVYGENPPPLEIPLTDGARRAMPLTPLLGTINVGIATGPDLDVRFGFAQRSMLEQVASRASEQLVPVFPTPVEGCQR